MSFPAAVHCLHHPERGREMGQGNEALVCAFSGWSQCCCLHMLIIFVSAERAPEELESLSGVTAAGLGERPGQ